MEPVGISSNPTFKAIGEQGHKKMLRGQGPHVSWWRLCRILDLGFRPCVLISLRVQDFQMGLVLCQLRVLWLRLPALAVLPPVMRLTARGHADWACCGEAVGAPPAFKQYSSINT